MNFIFKKKKDFSFYKKKRFLFSFLFLLMTPNIMQPAPNNVIHVICS